MNLAVISAFRDSHSTGQLVQYRNRILRLRDTWPGSLRLIALEGDSRDRTPRLLRSPEEWPGIAVTYCDVSHGKEHFGSVESEARFRALSRIGNRGLEMIELTDDVVWYVESDLLWDPMVPLCLSTYLQKGAEIVAPLVFAGRHFYDVFAYRGLDGSRFAPFPPYHSSLNGPMNEVSSVGSAFVMKADVARICRMGENGVLPGFCADARSKGFHVFVNTSLRVEHPA